MKPPAQTGFTLVATIFAVTVLAALAVFLVTIATTQQATSLLSIQGARAYAAAASGTEWATRQAVVANACADTSFTLTAGALNGFEVEVSCEVTAVTEAAVPYNIYALTVTASSGTTASGDFVSRTLIATITNAP